MRGHLQHRGGDSWRIKVYVGRSRELALAVGVAVPEDAFLFADVEGRRWGPSTSLQRSGPPGARQAPCRRRLR
jgi:hypothetical protein